MAEFRAPAKNGEVLAVPDFAAVPALVEQNRRKLDRDDVTVGGLPLKELRALARREVLELARGSFSSPSPLAGEGSRAAAGEGESYATGSGSPPTRRRSAADLPLEGQVACPSFDAPLLVTGHQPELSHPGVWVKNFALAGLAKKLGGIGLHLVADTDTLKSTSLRFPVIVGRGPKAFSEPVAFDRLDGQKPYEHREVLDPEQFRTFPKRAGALWANWGYEPLVASAWTQALDGWPGMSVTNPRWTYGAPIPPLPRGAGNVGHLFTTARHHFERQWGCENLELPVSWLSHTAAFAHFLWQIITDLPRFRETYNAAVGQYRQANGIESTNHPVPDLTQNGGWVEAPFWGYLGRHGRRTRPFVRADGADLRWRLEDGNPFGDVPLPRDVNDFVRYVPKYMMIRPRALTLTLFARVCLGDFFIHGIGGGKYDEVTDAIIRDYFHIDPPAYQVLSATLHLPLPGFPSTPDDLKRAERRVRDLHWNPQRHLSPENLARPEVRTLIERKAALASAEPPRADRAARREWFRELQKVTEELRPFVFKQEPVAKAELRRVRVEVAANEVLRRRDYAWVLYPEESLRPFLQRFLNV